MIIFPPRNILTTQPLYTVILSEAKDLDFCCCPLHQTQPPHTVILPEAKDPDFCCCPSFIDVFNTINYVLRFAQVDISKRFKLWKEIGCSLTNNHTSDPHLLHQTQPLYIVILSAAKDLDFCCCT